MFNYYWHDELKLKYVWCRFFAWFFQGVLAPKNKVGFLGITEMSEP